MKPTAKILLVLLAVLTAQTVLGQSSASFGLYKESYVATYEHPDLFANLGITCTDHVGEQPPDGPCPNNPARTCTFGRPSYVLCSMRNPFILIGHHQAQHGGFLTFRDGSHDERSIYPNGWRPYGTISNDSPRRIEIRFQDGTAEGRLIQFRNAQSVTFERNFRGWHDPAMFR